MSDVSRKVVPDKGSLHRERPVTKALKFPSRTRKTVFHLRLREGEYTEKNEDPIKKQQKQQKQKTNQKRFTRKLIYFNTDTQSAHFRGIPFVKQQNDT